MTPREVLALCREKDVAAVDLRCADLFGSWRQYTLPVAQLTEDLFEDGLGIDGSAVPLWQPVERSDLVLIPQSETARIDPLAAVPTLLLLGTLHDPVTAEPYPRDPRQIARKAANHLRHTGIADVAQFGVELEYFVFGTARFASACQEAFYHLEAPRPEVLAGRSPGDRGGLGETPLAAAPAGDLPRATLHALLEAGVEVQSQHWRPNSGGQAALALCPQPLVAMADVVQVAKHCLRNVARQHGHAATFMPQPLAGGPGSGMHVSLSLWREEEPLLAGAGYGGLSDIGQYALGGILRHAPALLAFACPSTNSYKRLVPGREAPVYLVHGQGNRSAACRVPLDSASPKARRIEFRCPDPLSNPYLLFAAITMAAIDGIQTKLSPGAAVESDLHRAAADASRDWPRAPATLDEALAALASDQDFLLRDDVFTPEVIQTWIEHKRQAEIQAIRLRPHPFEFELYFNA